MSLDGFLAFVGILIAIYGLADPIQRVSLRVFVPWKRLWLFLALSLVPIVISIAVEGKLLSHVGPWTLFTLRLVSFVLPLVATGISWWFWDQAQLTHKENDGVKKMLQTSLREGRFDEAERVLSKNRTWFRSLDDSHRTVRGLVFDPKLIGSMFRSRSFLHLDLLSDVDHLNSLGDNRYALLFPMVRELLTAEASPLRSVVLKQCGGVESHYLLCADTEEKVINQTFLNPDWYHLAEGHYPILRVVLERLKSGEWDVLYNSIDCNYAATQGVSSRSRCPIFLGMKTHVLAVLSAIKNGNDRNYYITDLLDIFRKILGRCRYDEAIWTNSNSTHPTPYTYLLHQIIDDLKELSCEAIKTVRPGGAIASQIALSWRYCVHEIVKSENKVGKTFQDDAIQGYLLFILQLGWNPHEAGVCLQYQPSPTTDLWRDLFSDELKSPVLIDPEEQATLKAAFHTLDLGKRYVREGRNWLMEQHPYLR